MKVSVSALAMDVAKYASPTSVTEVTAEPYNFDMASVSISSTAVGTVKSFSWTFANNIKTDHAYHLGSAKPTYLPEGGRQNDLTVEIHPTNTTYWDNWLADPQTEATVEILFTRSANDTIKFTFSAILYEDAEIELPEETGTYVQTLTLKPRTVQIEVVDSNATYP